MEDILAETETIVLANAATFPASGAIWLDGEVIYYAGRSGNTLTGLARGMAGTAAVEHPRGTVAILVISDCVGDCNGNFRVTVDELVKGVGMTLGNQEVSACPLFDRNGDGRVTIDELVAAVTRALGNCPLPEIPAITFSPHRHAQPMCMNTSRGMQDAVPPLFPLGLVRSREFGRPAARWGAT